MFDVDSILEAPPETRRPSAPKRARRQVAASAPNARNPKEIRHFPSWAGLSDTKAVGPDAAFHAGAALALFDRLLRAGEDGAEPAFAGVLRRRLALQAAARCARLARLPEDEAGLRDAAHLAPDGAAASPGGRLHRLFREFGERPLRSDRETLIGVAELLGLRVEAGTLLRLVGALQETAPKSSPLAAAASMSRAAMTALADAAPLDAELFALWLADLALAQKLGWIAPVPLIATRIDHPALRTGPNGRRARPNDPEWPETIARATALACQNATVLGAELSRRADKLMLAAPKLRARGAVRVIDMLLSDDCITPSRAAKASVLSDRAARRLFDRLIELGAVRELSGRANFRLYGL